MELIIKITIFILGACLGSFYACAGYRIPNKISLIKPGSRCDSCNKELTWYMNIPLISYLLLKRKCAYCGKKIDSISFVIEILTASSFLVAYIFFGLTYKLIIILVLISALMITLVSDIKYYYISDRVLIFTTLTILITCLIKLPTKLIVENIISSLIAFILMLVIKLLGDKIFKKESLGGGDIKLMIPIALTLGLLNTLVALFLASILALIYALITYKNNKGIIPFGPALLLACIIIYILSNIGVYLI